MREIKNHEEHAPWVALIPVLATVLFYLLPTNVQQYRLIQFLPQLFAYVALGFWCSRNSVALKRLGVMRGGLTPGLKWGVIVGGLLGGFNTIIILWVAPNLGGDIEFLKETPHAQMPTWVMVPWGILIIAMGVELNFRGFLLGRLEAMFRRCFRHVSSQNYDMGSFLSIVSSALIFAFDPFMVTTFQHLHWIAVWDGLVWGWMVVRMKNLSAVIVAHAVEVVILYLSLEAALS